MQQQYRAPVQPSRAENWLCAGITLNALYKMTALVTTNLVLKSRWHSNKVNCHYNVWTNPQILGGYIILCYNE